MSPFGINIRATHKRSFFLYSDFNATTSFGGAISESRARFEAADKLMPKRNIKGTKHDLEIPAMLFMFASSIV